MGIINNSTTKLSNKAKLVTNYKEINSSFTYIKDMINTMSLGHLAKKGIRVETFEQAVARLELSEADIIKAHNYQFYQWLLYGVGAFLAISALIIYAVQGYTWGACAALGYSSVLSAMMVINSFRMYQIQQRNLCSFSEWVLTKGSFFPKAV